MKLRITTDALSNKTALKVIKEGEDNFFVNYYPSLLKYLAVY